MPPQHILVPLDCRASTRRVLDYALTLAGQLQARLTLLHVLEMPALTDTAEGASSPTLQHVSVSVAAYIHQAEAEKRHILDTYTQQAHQAGLQCDTMLIHGVPFQQILDLVQPKEVDLILMGTQGRTGLQHVFLGSVAEKVVRLAECPVLVVHGEDVQ
jgi:nucleotide-binding universal stress UspA family protein